MVEPQTAAQVGQQALQMLQSGVLGVVDMIKAQAPVVWHMAKRQVIIEGVENLVISVGAAYGAAKSWKYVFTPRPCNVRGYCNGCGTRIDIKQETLFDDEKIWILLPIASTALAIVIVSYAGSEAVEYLLNSDWATLVKLTELAKK
jgi:hypothetical protein